MYFAACVLFIEMQFDKFFAAEIKQPKIVD